MTILITAGCTKEPIDGIRKITSIPSIELGIKIATKAIEKKHNVIFVSSEEVTDKFLLNNNSFKQHLVASFDETYNTLQKIFENCVVDYLIQTMAISDFKVGGYVYKNDILDKNIKDIDSILKNNSNKISSDQDILLYLKRAPKIICQIKKWSPDTKIIGFKLLVDANQKEKTEAIYKQFNNADSDFVVYNDWKNIDNDKHIAELYSKKDKTSPISYFKNKTEIACGLINLIGGEEYEL